jgi:hypothetical protein
VTPLYIAEVEETRVRYRFPDSLLGAEVLQDLVVEYSGAVDLTTSSPSTLAIPVVANLAPVIWATGATYTVPVLDSVAVESLERLRTVLADRYPKIDWSGEIHPDAVEQAAVSVEDSADPRSVALLFSGGLDSVYSSMAIPEPQLLITGWGNDISDENEVGWEAMYADAAAFARAHGHRSEWFRTNFRRVLDERRLRNLTGLNWWGEVQHGVGIVAVTAPLVASLDIQEIYLAGTTPSTYSVPWGSDEAVVEAFHWGPVRVAVQGAKVERQAKAAFVASRFSAGTGKRPILHVCWEHPDSAGANCCRCQKCLRTAIALAIEDEDYQEYGFPVSPEEIEKRVRSAMATRTLRMTPIDVRLWGEVQQRLRNLLAARDNSTEPRVRPFEWVVDLDLESYRKLYRRRARVKGPIVHAMHRVPKLERIGRKTVRSLRRLRGRG